MKRLAWYLKRLAVMGPREMAHRIGEQIEIRTMRQAHRRGAAGWPACDAAEYRFCTATDRQLPVQQWDDGAAAATAEALLAGEGAALGYEWAWRDDPDIWRRAPDTGRLWPRQFFADIPYRVGNPYGDIRVVWEPSRLQHLVALALLARASDGPESADAVRMMDAQFRSWLAANPPMTGVHYLSAMECALRLIAVCHAFDLARERLQDCKDAWAGVAALVAGHAPFILRRLSLYSSAGNHTIAEAAALVYAGVLFPEFDEAPKWKGRGLALLETEAARQVLADGGGIERAFAYHRFVVDLLGLSSDLLAHQGERIPAAVADAVDRGRGHLAELEDGLGLLPPVGDGDGGHALGPHLSREIPARAVPGGATVGFPVSGYTLLRMDRDAVSALLDHGPLGMGPGFGHAHADALSLTVYCNGRALLAEPGTFTYTGDPVWRRYFRSTRAHNTVEIDGLDQARQQTAFQWSRAYRCELVRNERGAEGEVWLLARHDGYRSLGVIHWRGVAYRPGRWLLVWDRIEGKGKHCLALHWHCGAPVASTDGGFRIEAAGRSFFLNVQGGPTLVHRGESDPPLGWISPAYGVRRPISTLRSEYCGALPHEFITQLGTSPEATTLDAVRDDIQMLRRWVGAG